MKIQPIDFYTPEDLSRYEAVKPVAKSRFKRLFDFPSFLRVSAADRVAGVEEPQLNKDGVEEFEPSSVCLDKMVQNFMEDSNEKHSGAIRCGRNQCRCFNGESGGDSEDELDSFNCFGNSNHNSSNDACELLKTLVVCASVSERNLLADTAKIIENSKVSKDESGRNVVVESLINRGYDASVCKSRWEKSPLYPAGEYEYVDVITGGERLIIDIDFRSEFEIARATKHYKAILQTLPYIFVGKPDRLQRIIHIVSDAAKQSLKKKGMHIPPWRKADYIKAKWLSPHTRGTRVLSLNSIDNNKPGEIDLKSDNDFEVEKKMILVVKQWEPQGIKRIGGVEVQVATVLASVIEDKPE